MKKYVFSLQIIRLIKYGPYQFNLSLTRSLCIAISIFFFHLVKTALNIVKQAAVIVVLTMFTISMTMVMTFNVIHVSLVTTIPVLFSPILMSTATYRISPIPVFLSSVVLST